jgi:hypothetical protein
MLYSRALHMRMRSRNIPANAREHPRRHVGVTDIITLFMEAGVDGMLPFEFAAGIDIGSITRQYPDFIISSGIGKREIANAREAIDRELERLPPAMLARGGYPPPMDYHVPPEMSYADFQYYLERTREY